MNLTKLEQCEFIDSEKLKTLKDKTVAILGLGGVGITVAQMLARNGINLRIVDKDRVDEKDMARLTLYLAEDITKFKAKQAKKRLEEVTKDVKIKTFHEELHEDNVFLLEADLIIDTSNDMKTSLMVNEFALEKEIPLIFSNYAGAKGNVLVVDRQQHKKCASVSCIQDKLELPTVKQAGAYSPITLHLAALVVNAALKNLLDIENVETQLKIDILKTETRHVKVEKARKRATKKK